MKFRVIHVPFLPATGMALFPFILVKHPHVKNDRQIIRHELIHFRQQLELLILPFYILYLLNYLVNRLRYSKHDEAYRNIVFEREAYRNEANEEYLQQRRFWAWLTYF